LRRSLIHTVELDGKAFAAARAVIACAEVESIRITRSKFGSRIHMSEAPQVELTTSSKTEELIAGGKLTIFLDLSLRGLKGEEVWLEIAARIEAQYSLPDDATFTAFQLKSFARANAMLNVWPYWRDFVQSTVQRAALPPLTLPLFRVIHKPKVHIQGGTKAIAAKSSNAHRS